MDLYQGTTLLAANGKGASIEWVQGNEYPFVEGGSNCLISYQGKFYIQKAPIEDPNIPPSESLDIWQVISADADILKGIAYENGKLVIKLGSGLSFDANGNIIATNTSTAYYLSATSKTGSGGIIQGQNDYIKTLDNFNINITNMVQAVDKGYRVYKNIVYNFRFTAWIKLGAIPINPMNCFFTVINSNNFGNYFPVDDNAVYQIECDSSDRMWGVAFDFQFTPVADMYINLGFKTDYINLVDSDDPTEKNKINAIPPLILEYAYFNINSVGGSGGGGGGGIEAINDLSEPLQSIVGGDAISVESKADTTDTASHTIKVKYDNTSIGLNEDTQLQLKNINLAVTSGDESIVQDNPSTYDPNTNTLTVGLKAVGGGGGGITSINGSTVANQSFNNTDEIFFTTEQLQGTTTANIGDISSDKILVPAEIIPPAENISNTIPNFIIYYGVGSNLDVPYADIPLPSYVPSEINIITYLGFALYNQAAQKTQVYGVPTSAKYSQIPNLVLSVGGENYTQADNCPWNPNGGQTASAFVSDMLDFLNTYTNCIGIDFDIEGGLAADPSIPAWLTQAVTGLIQAKPNLKISLVLADQLSAGQGAYAGFLPYQKALIKAVHDVAPNNLTHVSKMTFSWGITPIAEVGCNTSDPNAVNSCVYGSIQAAYLDLVSLLNISAQKAKEIACPIYMVGSQNGQASNGVDTQGNKIEDQWFKTNCSNMLNSGFNTAGYWCSNADCLPQPVTSERWKYLNMYHEATGGIVPPTYETLTDTVEDIYSRINIINTEIVAINQDISSINTQIGNLDTSVNGLQGEMLTVSNELFANSTLSYITQDGDGIEIDYTLGDHQIRFDLAEAPTELFFVTLNFVNVSEVHRETTNITIYNDSDYDFQQINIGLNNPLIPLGLAEKTFTLYKNSAIFIKCVYTGLPVNEIIPQWSVDYGSTNEGIDNIVSNNGSVLVSSSGEGIIYTITSNNNSINVESSGVGRVTAIQSNNNSLNVQVL